MKRTAPSSGMGAQQKATLLPGRRGRSGGGGGRNVVKTCREQKTLEKVIFRRHAWPSINPSAFPDERGWGRGEKTLTRRVDGGQGGSAFRFHRKHPVTMLSRDKRRAPSARAGFRNVASLRRPHMIKSAGEGFFMGFLRGLSRVTEKLRANLAPAILLQAASCVDTRAIAMPITGDLVRIVTNLLFGGLTSARHRL